MALLKIVCEKISKKEEKQIGFQEEKKSALYPLEKQDEDGNQETDDEVLAMGRRFGGRNRYNNNITYNRNYQYNQRYGGYNKWNGQRDHMDKIEEDIKTIIDMETDAHLHHITETIKGLRKEKKAEEKNKSVHIAVNLDMQNQHAIPNKERKKSKQKKLKTMEQSPDKRQLRYNEKKMKKFGENKKESEKQKKSRYQQCKQNQNIIT